MQRRAVAGLGLDEVDMIVLGRLDLRAQVLVGGAAAERAHQDTAVAGNDGIDEGPLGRRHGAEAEYPRHHLRARDRPGFAEPRTDLGVVLDVAFLSLLVGEHGTSWT